MSLSYPHRPASGWTPASVLSCFLSAGLVVALAACNQPSGGSGPGPLGPGSPAGSTTATATTSAPAPAGPDAAVPPPLDDNGPTDAGPAGRPDAASAELAEDRAVAFLRAFARTDLPQTQWWDGISGFFTPSAAAVYRSTDVANVPVHRVAAGSAKLRPDSTRYRAEVEVATDDGTYTVVLVRADDTWLVDRALPPRSGDS